MLGVGIGIFATVKYIDIVSKDRESRLFLWNYSLKNLSKG